MLQNGQILLKYLCNAGVSKIIGTYINSDQYSTRDRLIFYVTLSNREIKGERNQGN